MSEQKKRINKYDVFIFFLITSLVSGCLFGALQLPRVLALLLFFPSLESLSEIRKQLSSLMGILLLFLLYSFVSSLWNPAGIEEGFISAIYNVVHVLLFFEIIAFSRRAKDPIRAIIYGFLVAFAISAVIASWELTTDHHLSLSKKDEARLSNTGEDIFVRYFASVTFYNANNYVIFLCYLLPFLFYGFSNKNYGKLYNIIYIVASVSAIVLALMNGSRGGALSITVMIFVFFYFALFRRKGFTLYVLLFVIVISFVLIRYGTDILNTLIMRATAERALQEESRFEVWYNVLVVTCDYFFLGCGANGLEEAMIKVAPNDTIHVAHNIFLEILSEYGLFFLIMFLTFLIKIFKKARRKSDINRKVCLYQLLFAFPIIGIVNSGYVTQPMLWAVVASLYVFAYWCPIKNLTEPTEKGTNLSASPQRFVILRLLQLKFQIYGQRYKFLRTAGTKSANKIDGQVKN